MKLFGVLLLLISAFMSGERRCPHAHDLEKANGDCHEMVEGHAAHAGMSDHIGDDHQGAPQPSDHHCPDDCKGGSDCSGCSTLSATILANTIPLSNPAHGAFQSRVVSDVTAARDMLEPPPPKVPSLI